MWLIPNSIWIVEAYLDHAATTPIKDLALDALVRTSKVLGNPSGTNKAARKAKDLLEQARDSIAGSLGVKASQVVFTSGGTEANNLALLGSVREGKSLLCSAVEHHAVLEPVERANGYIAGVSGSGVMDMDQLVSHLEDFGDEIATVSVMMANNETGVVQPINEISRIVRRYLPEALFHSDAVQVPSYLDIAAISQDLDMISISAHKFGGPKGVGALVIKRPERLHPIIYGGGQEWELRSGTQNLAGIVAMSFALSDAVDKRNENVQHVAQLTQLLRSSLAERLDGLAPNGGDALQLPNISNYCFDGLNSEEILFLLDSAGVYASAGSSCASGALNPSHVLLAMGKSRQEAKGSLRLSLGVDTTRSEVEYAVDVVVNVISRLRGTGG